MRIPAESLDTRYSDPAAAAVPWAVALQRLAAAEVAWIVTVRPDGRPHATPMVPVTDDGKIYFHTGRHEVKFANLQQNPHVLVLAGDTAWKQGLDVMVDGVAAPVTDASLLRRIAELYRARWDGRWMLDAGADGMTSAAASDAEIVVLEVTPALARGHAKGDPFGQTTYRFDARGTDEEGTS